ncbi:unnamed protein product [Adineta steineri]|nr:unnamed protein product [Adineta steineri]
MNSPLINSGGKPSKWKKNKLVIIPAIFKEINWADHSSWPLWLRKGLDLFNKNNSQPYDIHLYQRLDPDSKPPYNWPYCHNVHEEAGVYLKFIYDYYYDLPDKMLFIHARPEHHSLYPIDAVQCIRDDVAYTSVNDIWLQERPWGPGLRDPTDNLTLMYKCARRLLTLFGFNGEAQLNPDYSISRNYSVISAMCCAQFYVRKERIRHYTYAQWSSVYNASLQPYCTTSRDRELPGRPGIKWFGGGFELIWHIILGLEPANMPPPRAKTNTDLCHLFRPSCKGSLCGNGIIKFLTHSKPSKTNHTSVNTTLL